MKFRDLTVADVECRVQSVSEKGAVLLIYKDARCDMNVLDETVGAENWQREHYECKGNLFCRVGIRTDGGEWVWKSDCGTESNTEPQKGEASDSFKRACFNIGIGRELYTAPFIFVKNGDCTIIKNDKGRLCCNDRFDVVKMTVENKVITALEIKNAKTGKTVFVYGASTAPATKDAAYIYRLWCFKFGEGDEAKVVFPYMLSMFGKTERDMFTDAEAKAIEDFITASTLDAVKKRIKERRRK